jgi:Flp pilus assembly pilin Flp
MEFFKRLCREEDGQGLVEYTFVVMLVALVFWMGVKDTAVGDVLAKNWAKIVDCVNSPFSCSA